MARGKKGIEFYTIKCKLKSILKNPELAKLIRSRVLTTNQLITEAYFLFNLYILHQLKKDALTSFDKVTIQRCALFVLGKGDSFRTNDKRNNNEIKTLRKVYNSLYKQLGLNQLRSKDYHFGDNSICEHNDFKNIKSINKPIESLSVELMTNIETHLWFRFHQFQKKYIKHKVLEEFKLLKYRRSVLNPIVNCVLSNINSKTTNYTVRSRKLYNHKDFKLISLIMKKIIDSEKLNVPISILGNVKEKNLISNKCDVLKYYYFMLQFLEKNKFKRFSILPQRRLGLSFIKFESRLLSVLYNEIYNKKVPIKEFEKKYKDYYKELFNLNKFKYQNKLKHNLISIKTDGYSVCLLYERPKKKSKAKPNGKNKKEVVKVKLEEAIKNKRFKKGLFEADLTEANDEYLNGYHIYGIDPGNDTLLYCADEAGNKITISRGFYYQESHINRNTQKMKKYMEDHEMHTIYEALQLTGYRKTVDISKYSQLITIIRNNWDKIWGFYSLPKVQKLPLDTFIYKQKAMQKIVRKIVPKHNKGKPIMIAFGKGNGSTTISNLKHSKPKGPVKALAKKLSEVSTVVLTDEYNTSQYCSSCNDEKLEHPLVKCFKTRKIRVTELGKKLRKKIKELVEVKSYRLCICQNKNHTSNKMCSHNYWNRDFNAARNILQVMRKKLTGRDLGVFKRKKEEYVQFAGKKLSTIVSRIFAKNYLLAE